MYREILASEHKRKFGLPDDYSVSGFLSYGAWDDSKYFSVFDNVLKELLTEYSSRKLPEFLKGIQEATIKGKIYWISIAYGGTLLSEYLHLACLFGSQKNIHLGSCGGLCAGMKSLDLLLPDRSFGDESTTRSYARATKNHKHSADATLARALKSSLDKTVKIWNGPVVTTQAMLSETQEDIESWSRAGYYGVEMETATVFAVSGHFAVPSAALLYVYDNLLTGQTVYNNNLELVEEREKVIKEICSAGLKTILE